MPSVFIYFSMFVTVAVTLCFVHGFHDPLPDPTWVIHIYIFLHHQSLRLLSFFCVEGGGVEADFCAV
jgi:hypothetical protein